MEFLAPLVAALVLVPLVIANLLKVKSKVKDSKVKQSYNKCVSLLDAYLQGSELLKDDLDKLDKAIVADALAIRARRCPVGELMKLRGLFKDLGCFNLSIAGLKKTNTREEKIGAVVRLGDIGIGEAVEGIAELLDDPDVDVRCEAASALGRIGTKDAILRILDHLERSEDIADLIPAFLDISEEAREFVLEYLRVAEVKERLIKLLGEAGADWALEDIRALAFTGDIGTRLATVGALGKIGDRNSCTVLEEIIADSNYRIRAAAAKSLGELKCSSSCYLLAHSLTDEIYQVRQNASEALLMLGHIGERTLIKMLFSEDRQARKKAAETLETSGIVDRYFSWLIDGDESQKQESSLVIEALIDAGITGRLDDYFGEHEKSNLKKLIRLSLRKISTRNRDLRQATILRLVSSSEVPDNADPDNLEERNNWLDKWA